MPFVSADVEKPGRAQTRMCCLFVMLKSHDLLVLSLLAVCDHEYRSTETGLDGPLNAVYLPLLIV